MSMMAIKADFTVAPRFDVARLVHDVAGGVVLAGIAWLGAELHAIGLALPGPVIGLVVLALAMVIIEARHRALSRRLVDLLAPATRLSLRHMGLLFVPAGVGIVTQGDMLRAFWLPIAAGLIGSSLIGIVVTAFVVHRLGAAEPTGRDA